jgi:hypothetical protein
MEDQLLMSVPVLRTLPYSYTNKSALLVKICLKIGARLQSVHPRFRGVASGRNLRIGGFATRQPETVLPAGSRPLSRPSLRS